MNYFLSCSKLEIVLAYNLSNQAWIGPNKVRGNALHRVVALAFAIFNHVLYVWMWPTGSVFPSYKGMVGILKVLKGMVVEMLIRNEDCVSDKNFPNRIRNAVFGQ